MDSPITFDYLKKMNIIAAFVHGIQGVLMLAASFTVPGVKDFKKPLTTSFLTFDFKTQSLVPETKQIALLPIASFVSIFLFLSMIAHIVIAWVAQDTYRKDIAKGVNRFRWHEYALSSSVMIALIAMFFGDYDAGSLLGLVGCNISMNYFGAAMEQVNQYTDKVEWATFWYGCVAGLVPWLQVLLYFLGGGNFSEIPTFVYAILGSYFFFFNTFPINMYLQYARVGRWADYRFGELCYIWLSMLSKSLLAWLVFGGSFQPN